MIFHVTYYISIRLDSLKWMTTVSGVLQNSWIQMTDCRNVVTISSHFGVCCVSRLTYHSLRHGPRWVSISQIVFINRSSTNVIWDLFFGLPDRILPDRIFVIIKCNWLFVSLVLPQELPYKCLISRVFLFCSAMVRPHLPINPHYSRLSKPKASTFTSSYKPDWIHYLLVVVLTS